MSEPPSNLVEQIGAKSARKLRAREQPVAALWTGLGVMGLVGWSVVVPTLLGAAIGKWLDGHHPGSYSWTLALMVGGLSIGCLNAWRWVVKDGNENKDGNKNE